VNLCIYDKGFAIFIDKVESTQTVRMYSKIGRSVYMHCTGVGKALLSGMSIEKVDEIINKVGLPKRTNNTITSREELLEAIELTKVRGYALDEVENEEGIASIAAPIRDYTGEVIAAVSIAGPNSSFTSDHLEKVLKPLILETVAEISREMGYIN
ncbi:MAG: IclR family transcriptional regulator, partial [Bacillus sp. (in: Bacteria)]|nr:IclR family transcriptional regulator [Bacillus sp. (in: firmicutes)]